MIMIEVNSTTLKNWAIIWSNILRNNSPHVTHLTEDMKKMDHKAKDGFNLHTYLCSQLLSLRLLHAIFTVNVNYEQEEKTGNFSVKLYKNAYVTHTFQHDVIRNKSVRIIT